MPTTAVADDVSPQPCSSILLAVCVVTLLVACPVRGATFTMYSKTVDLGVKLSYKMQDSKAYFLIEKMTAGFVAFGIGASMADADIVLIEKNPSDPTKLTLKDCKLKGQMAPICSETSEDWMWVAADSYTSSATMMKAEIMRTMAASGKDEDTLIYHN